jgi:hypothetical protein
VDRVREKHPRCHKQPLMKRPRSMLVKQVNSIQKFLIFVRHAERLGQQDFFLNIKSLLPNARKPQNNHPKINSAFNTHVSSG